MDRVAVRVIIIVVPGIGGALTFSPGFSINNRILFESTVGQAGYTTVRNIAMAGVTFCTGAHGEKRRKGHR